MFFNLYISLFFNKMRFEETQRTRKEVEVKNKGKGRRAWKNWKRISMCKMDRGEGEKGWKKGSGKM